MLFYVFGVGEGEGICIFLESMLFLLEIMIFLENDVLSCVGRC